MRSLVLLTIAACGTTTPEPIAPPLVGATDAGVDAPTAEDLGPTAVLTFHNDNRRTGAYLREKILTPDAVAHHGLYKRLVLAVDNTLNAQVLYLPDLDGRAVAFAATVGNSLYAFDVATGGTVWTRTFHDPASTTRIYARGIYSTPVIDPDAGILYAVYATKDSIVEPLGENHVDLAFWLVAVDIHTGTTLRETMIAGSVPRNDGTTLAFLPRNHRQRPGLLLSNGSIWVAFATRSKEELIEYHGWVIGYDAKTFAPRGVYCTTPNRVGASIAGAGEGAGIWQSGAGLAADAAGDIYVITANAAADISLASMGNMILKLHPDTSEGTLSLAAWFAPYDPLHNLEINDVDLGSGGAMLIPGADRVLGGGKTGIYYLLTASTLAEQQEFPAFVNTYHPDIPADSGWDVGPHIHGGEVWWRGPDPDLAYVYGWSEKDRLKAYRYSMSQGQFVDVAHPVTGSIVALDVLMPGGIISLSADGNKAATGILWATLPSSAVPDPTFGELPGWILAFDAETLELLWKDDFPTLPKWMPPTIADGHVFVPTSSKQIEVYELAK
jgi:outer membrane protein assembly factor BamB